MLEYVETPLRMSKNKMAYDGFQTVKGTFKQILRVEFKGVVPKIFDDLFGELAVLLVVVGSVIAQVVFMNKIDAQPLIFGGRQFIFIEEFSIKRIFHLR